MVRICRVREGSVVSSTPSPHAIEYIISHLHCLESKGSQGAAGLLSVLVIPLQEDDIAGEMKWEHQIHNTMHRQGKMRTKDLHTTNKVSTLWRRLSEQSFTHILQYIYCEKSSFIYNNVEEFMPLRGTSA